MNEIEKLEELVHKRTYRTGEVRELGRIASAMEEILFLIKTEMKKSEELSKKYEEKN